MSPDLELEYPIWRVWKESGTPLNELRWEWTYEDIIKANAILDMKFDMELAYNEGNRSEGDK